MDEDPVEDWSTQADFMESQGFQAALDIMLHAGRAGASSSTSESPQPGLMLPPPPPVREAPATDEQQEIPTSADGTDAADVEDHDLAAWLETAARAAELPEAQEDTFQQPVAETLLGSEEAGTENHGAQEHAAPSAVAAAEPETVEESSGEILTVPSSQPPMAAEEEAETIEDLELPSAEVHCDQSRDYGDRSGPAAKTSSLLTVEEAILSETVGQLLETLLLRHCPENVKNVPNMLHRYRDCVLGLLRKGVELFISSNQPSVQLALYAELLSSLDMEPEWPAEESDPDFFTGCIPQPGEQLCGGTAAGGQGESS